MSFEEEDELKLRDLETTSACMKAFFTDLAFEEVKKLRDSMFGTEDNKIYEELSQLLLFEGSQSTLYQSAARNI
jgi:hypothetical protein